LYQAMIRVLTGPLGVTIAELIAAGSRPRIASPCVRRGCHVADPGEASTIGGALAATARRWETPCTIMMILAFLAVIGCAPTRMVRHTYDGPRRALDEVAVIRLDPDVFEAFIDTSFRFVRLRDFEDDRRPRRGEGHTLAARTSVPLAFIPGIYRVTARLRRISDHRDYLSSPEEVRIEDPRIPPPKKEGVVPGLHTSYELLLVDWGSPLKLSRASLYEKHAGQYPFQQSRDLQTRYPVGDLQTRYPVGLPAWGTPCSLIVSVEPGKRYRLVYGFDVGGELQSGPYQGLVCAVRRHAVREPLRLEPIGPTRYLVFEDSLTVEMRPNDGS